MQQQQSDGPSIDVSRRHGFRGLLQVSLIVCMLVLVNGQPRPAAWNFLTGIADKTAAVTQAVTDPLLPNLGRRTMSPVSRHAVQAAAVRQVHAAGIAIASLVPSTTSARWGSCKWLPSPRLAHPTSGANTAAAGDVQQLGQLLQHDLQPAAGRCGEEKGTGGQQQPAICVLQVSARKDREEGHAGPSEKQQVSGVSGEGGVGVRLQGLQVRVLRASGEKESGC